MRSHSVTCQPAEVTFPPLPQPKLVLDLATPEGCKAELTWEVVFNLPRRSCGRLVLLVNYCINLLSFNYIQLSFIMFGRITYAKLVWNVLATASLACSMNHRHRQSVANCCDYFTGMKSCSRRLGLETLFRNVSVSSQSRENLVRSRSRSSIEPKTECLGFISVSGVNVSFYKLIFNDKCSLNLVPLLC